MLFKNYDKGVGEHEDTNKKTKTTIYENSKPEPKI
jgi:hypothetical protein